MMRYISRGWWLIMAWVLAMFGSDFWSINVGELFASLAIIVGVVWTYVRWRKERNRKLKLIAFPNTWKSFRMLSKESFEVWVDIDVLLPCDSKCVALSVWENGKILKKGKMEVEPISGSKTRRLRVTWNTPLALLPSDAKEVEVLVKITLDGNFSKKSKKRKVSIVDHGVVPIC